MLAISLVAFNILQPVDARHSDEGITLDLIPGFNQIDYRDSTNTNPQTHTLSLDTSTSRAGFVTIIVTEEDSNLNSDGVDIVLASATSTTGGLIENVELTESSVNSGTFSGQVFLSSTPQPGKLHVGPGDSISALYEPEHDGVGRFSADLRGVNQAGTVDIFDFSIDDPDGKNTRLGKLCPFDPVTHPVDLQLSPGLTADNVTVTISYANAVLEKPDKTLYNENELVMLYRWSSIFGLETSVKQLNGIIDPATKTITAFTLPIRSLIPGPTGLVETVSGQYLLGVLVENCGGGVGGGITRPGFVVNALAGSGSVLGLFTGGSGGGSNPTFGDASILVLENIAEGFGGIISNEGIGTGGGGGSAGGIDASLDSTKVVNTGDTVLLRFDLFENQGITNLERFRMFLNFEGENYDTSTMDTHITYKRGGEITVVDPHEKIEKVEIEILLQDPWNLIVNVKIIFKNTFNTSILVDSWDLDRNSGKKLFPDALQVVEPSILLADAQKVLNEPTSDLTLEILTETELTEIPVWIKSNALWWKQKQIDDSDFMAGIKYLIEKTMIEVDKNDLSNSLTTKEIPVWISDVAGMWADDSITDEEFINIMQWLISKGILQVQQ